METITYAETRDLWASLIGLPISTALTAEQLARFNRFFNRSARRGWEWFFWPALQLLEERVFRDAWSAQAYVSGNEVYYSATAGYYWRANATTTGADIPGTSSKWDLITTLDPYVAYEQTGKTAFTHVKEIFNANPRVTIPSARLPWQYDERGAVLSGSSVPPSVWVYFRQRCPKWLGADYDAGTAYASGQTRFYSSATTGYEGDYWTTNQATSAGQNPETNAAKWDKIQIPAFLGDFIANAAKILELQGDAKFEQALSADGPAWAWLYDARDKVQTQNVRRARAANV